MAKASEWGQAPRHLDFVRRSSMFATTNSSSANTANSYSTGATTISGTGIGAASSNDDSSRFYSSAFAHPTGEPQSSGTTSTSTATLSSNLSANVLSSNAPQRARGVLPPTPLTHSYRVTGGASPGCRGSPLPQQPLGGDNGSSSVQQQQQQQQQYDTHEAARKQVLDAMRIVRLYPAPLTCSAAYQVRTIHSIHSIHTCM
jgi:hypothetical protein